MVPTRISDKNHGTYTYGTQNMAPAGLGTQQMTLAVLGDPEHVTY